MKQETLPGFENEKQEYEPIGFSPDERREHLNQIQSDIEDIDGVTDVGWIAEPNYLDDAQLNIVLESEKTLDRNYQIQKNLRKLNREIKSVLEDYDDKISDDTVGFRPPQYVEPNVYKEDLYEVDLMML